MSRKRKAPKKLAVIDPKYKSTINPKLINSNFGNELVRRIVFTFLEPSKNRIEV